MRLLRTRRATLIGTAVALALAGLLAWSLPAALDRDDRAAAVEQLELRLTTSAAAATEDRAETSTLGSEIEAIEEDTASARERLEAAEKARRKLRRELPALRERLSQLGG